MRNEISKIRLNSNHLKLIAIIAKNGFVEPIMVNERIRSYRLSGFTKDHEKELKKELQHLTR